MTPKKAACAFEMLFAGKKKQKPPRIVRNRADSFGKAMNGQGKAAFRVEWAFRPEKLSKGDNSYERQEQSAERPPGP